MPSGSVPRIAVVGAGVPGLSAAFRLARGGFEVTLFEKSSDVGGRDREESIDGFCFGAALPLLRSNDRNVLDWIDDTGHGSALLPLEVVHARQLYRGGIHEIECGSLSGLANLPGVNLWDARRLLRLPRLRARYRPLLDPDRPERAAPLDFRGMADHTRLYLGKQFWRYWVAPSTLSTFGGDKAEVSRVAHLLEDVASGYGRATLGLLRGGLGDLFRGAAAEFELRLEAEVTGIEETNSGSFEVHCPGSRRSRLSEVDAVVLATPPAVSAALVESCATLAERDFFDGVRTGPSIALALALDRPLAAQHRFVRISPRERSPIECYLAERGGAGGRVPEGRSLVTLVANQRFADANASAPDEVLEKALVAAFTRIHPQSIDSRRFTHLFRSPNANPLFYVGAYRELDRFQRVQRDRSRAGRHLYYAGRYLAGPSLDNAVSSGVRAAKQVLRDFHRD